MILTKKETQQREILSSAHTEFGKSLNKYAFYKVNSHVVGEDLVQDTFIKTWNYLLKGGKIETMKAFLYHILNNLIIDEYRKRKASSLDVLIDNGFEPSVDDSSNLYNIIDGKRAMLLIKKLPEKYKKVMRMRYVEELTLVEMAKITGQSSNAIAVQAYRGLEKLKKLYRIN